MAWVSLTSFEGHMSIFGISADTVVIIPGYLALTMGLELLPRLVPLLYFDIPLVSCSLKQIMLPNNSKLTYVSSGLLISHFPGEISFQDL